MPHSSLTLIIPHYNTPKSLQSLVESLADTFPIVVVDNASEIRPKLPKSVQLIENVHNLGFSHACNQGAAVADTPWILFLNPDVGITVEQVNTLQRIARDEKWDVVSPLLVNDDGEVQWNYHRSRFSLSSVLSEYTPLKQLSLQFNRVTRQSILPGGCLLILRDVLNAVGGWDERFWLWWEDADLSERLYRARKQLTIVDSVQVTHLGGESFRPLQKSWRYDVFFHSLRIYAHRHLSEWSAAAVDGVTSRFSTALLYPADPNIRASIVVPNVRHDLLTDFLKTNLRHIDVQQDELIVVTSQEGIGEWRRQYPNVVFVGLERNRGFAHTVNTGFRRARGQYLITVNDDTILESTWVDKMVKAVKKNTGSVSPRVVSPVGEVESLGVHVEPKGKARPLTKLSSTPPNAFNAAAVLLTRAAIESVGLFDERFGSYLEDIDLGLRMHRQGWKHRLADEATVVHLRHQTSQSHPRRKAWQDVKNWWMVVFKNTSVAEWFRYGPAILIERLRNLSGFLKQFR